MTGELDPMVDHARLRGKVRVQVTEHYACVATLVSWPSREHSRRGENGRIIQRRVRVEFTSGARRTVRADQIIEVIPIGPEAGAQ